MQHRYERNIDPRIGKVNVCLFCSEPFRHPNHLLADIRRSSVDSIIPGNTSVANWWNVLAVLGAATDYIGTHDYSAYELLYAHIESFPLTLGKTV